MRRSADRYANVVHTWPGWRLPRSSPPPRSGAAAAAVPDSLHLNLQFTNSSGDPDIGRFLYTFNVTRDTNCSDVLASNVTDNATDTRGIFSLYLENLTLNFTEQYFLCIYTNNTLRTRASFAQVPYAYRARFINASGVNDVADLDLRRHDGYFRALFVTNWTNATNTHAHAASNITGNAWVNNTGDNVCGSLRIMANGKALWIRDAVGEVLLEVESSNYNVTVRNLLPFFFNNSDIGN